MAETVSTGNNKETTKDKMASLATTAIKKASPPRRKPSNGYGSHVQRLWNRLQEEEREIKCEKAKVKDVWLMIMDAHKKNEKERASIKDDGMFDFLEPTTRITLNVGGQVFETTAQLLCKDKLSVLASLCRKDASKNPFKPDKNGHYFIDRDWWIFRYILQYLRDGVLRGDPPLLNELYIEASFYGLSILRKAIQSSLSNTAVYDEGNRRNQFLDNLLKGTTTLPSSSSSSFSPFSPHRGGRLPSNKHHHLHYQQQQQQQQQQHHHHHRSSSPPFSHSNSRGGGGKERKTMPSDGSRAGDERSTSPSYYSPSRLATKALPDPFGFATRGA